MRPVRDSRTGGTWEMTLATSAVTRETPTSPLPPVLTMVIRSTRESGSATAPDPITGNFLALTSGVCWAFTMLGLRRLSREGPPWAPSPAAAAMVAGNVLAFAVTLPMALPVTSAGPEDVALIAYLGIFQIGLAYAFVSVGLKRVGALEASLHVDRDEWRQALAELGDFYQQFGDRMPPAIWKAHADTNRRFGL